MKQILLSASAVLAVETQNFMSFLAVHGKSYKSTNEFKERLALWNDSDRQIKNHNNDNNNLFKLAHNQFSDLTEQEK